MASLNKVFVIGNLGQDPELRYTPNQVAVANFSVATTDVRIDKEGKKTEQTEWHRIVVWNKQAENCAKYLSKGRPVFVEGKLQTRSWEDKTGQKRYTTEIVAQTIQFLGQPQAARDTADSMRSGADSGSSYGAGPDMSSVAAAGAMGGAAGLGGGDMAGLDDIPF